MAAKRLRGLRAGAVAGAAVGSVVVLLAGVRPELVERAEYRAYDVRVAASASDEPSADIVMVDIDESDIENAERSFGVAWPWPRAMYAYLTQYATRAGAKAILFDLIFRDRSQYSADDDDELAAALRESRRAVIGMPLTNNPVSHEVPEGRWGSKLAELDDRAAAVRIAERLLGWNVRAFLVDAGGKTELLIGGARSADALMVAWGRLAEQSDFEELFADKVPEPRELTDAELAGDYSIIAIMRERHGLPDQVGAVPELANLRPLVAAIGAAAPRLGNIRHDADPDGVVRRYAPLVRHRGKLYPSLALAGLMAASPDLEPRLDDGALVLGDRRIELDPTGQMLIRYYRRDRYPHVSAFEVLRSQALIDEGKAPSVSLESLKDKYLIVSLNAATLRDIKASPVARLHPGAEINANALDNMLRGEYVHRTSPLTDALLALFLAILAAFSVVLVWQSIRRLWLSLVATAACAAAWCLAWWLLARWIYAAQSVWIAAVLPIGGAAVASFVALLVTSAGERRNRRFVQEALGRYTSPALVAELTEHPEHLSLEWGERRDMSVYFSDIAGFTSISEGLEPEKLVALLNEYLTSMTDIVLAHDGVVDKYIGDAIMAFWGAPIADPDHARKAVLGALAMRKKCDELRAGWSAKYGEEVFARAGVNSGEAVVGNMGSAHKFNYTVMGDMVNLAARLEGANKPYGSYLMISEYTVDRIGDDCIAVRELDLLTVKGKEEPVRVFEVLDVPAELDPALARAVAAFAEGLDRYRRREFEAAIDDFERALRERPDDGPSRVYIDRCRQLIAEPPPDDWDGVWRLTTK
jgi:adenylate cyclase